MKITVVTISFNQAKFLRKCIDSVLEQSADLDIEYIVVDPGSKDGSREIISSYGKRLVSIFEADRGPADGLNRGFDQATGEVLCFINSDDFFYPGALALALQEFSRDPALELLLGSGYIVDETGNKTRRITPSHPNAWLYVQGAVTLFQQSMFFRRELFYKVGGFNVANRTCWDGELFLRFLQAGARWRRLSAAMAAFRIYPTSITGSQRFAAAYLEDHKRMYESVCGSSPQGAWQRRAARMLKLLDPWYSAQRVISAMTLGD